MKKYNNVVVFDLDGTVIRKNTFHLWVIHLTKKTEFLTRLRILRLYVLRAVGVIDHYQLKTQIIDISKKSLNYLDVTNFCKTTINKHINREVQSKINEENYNVLATAAIDIYAEEFSRLLNFDHCIATRTKIKPIIENKSTVKKNLVVDHLNSSLKSGVINLFYTDHFDDMPLIEVSEFSCIVDPNAETRKRLEKKLKSRYSIINS